ncbi:MAG: hypothetical protein V7636_385 [Actinomycetota bacterium]
MELKTLFGLPAHPLIVHVPIVLIPLVAIGAVAVTIVPSWRQRLGWALVVLSGVALVGVQLAIGSGEALEHYVERSHALHQHTELATSLRPLALFLFMALLALMLLDHFRRPRSGGNGVAVPTWVMPAVSVLVVLASVLSTARLVQIGHNGARASWGDVKLDKAHSREGGEGDNDRG